MSASHGKTQRIEERRTDATGEQDGEEKHVSGASILETSTDSDWRSRVTGALWSLGSLASVNIVKVEAPFKREESYQTPSQGECQTDTPKDTPRSSSLFEGLGSWRGVCVCVCVCVSEREREQERESGLRGWAGERGDSGREGGREGGSTWLMCVSETGEQTDRHTEAVE